jgi:hypothetical protein
MRRIAILIAVLVNSVAFAETNYMFRGTFTVEVPPRGDAPDWVYRAWLGLELPYTSKDNHTECINVVDLQQQQTGHYYLVPDEVAIKILERRDPQAAAWWRANNYPRNISFCFPDDPLLF